MVSSQVVRVESSVVVAEEGGVHLYSIPQSNNASGSGRF